MAIQVIKRNDTTANWTTNNPILALAEEGYDTDLKKFKIGDGSSTWTTLAFFESSAPQIQTDWEQTDSGELDFIQNKPTISGSNTGDQDLTVKANKELNNLVSTAANADIIPDANDTRSLGSAAKRWLTGYMDLIGNVLDTHALSGVSQYPPAQNDTYVKATTTVAPYLPYFATDPTRTLAGTPESNCWLLGDVTHQRFHIDLGSTKTITQIYYENLNGNGDITTGGVKDFTLWGSNSATAFAELTYGIDTDWTQLACSQSTFDKHVVAAVADPKYIIVANTTAYRYYAFKFADNWGYNGLMGIRRIELQLASLVNSKSIYGSARQLIGTDGTTPVLDWSNNNRLGVGTTNPQVKLDVNGVLASGMGSGNGEIRSYQSALILPSDYGNYVSLRTDEVAAKSGIFRNNTNAFPFYYDTNTGDTVLDRVYGAAAIKFNISGIEKMRISSSGHVGIGVTNPLGKLHLPAGTASLAPFMFSSGVDLTVPLSGALEYDGTLLKLTNSAAVRKALLFANAAITPGTKTKITYDANGLITSGEDIPVATVGYSGLAPGLVSPSPYSFHVLAYTGDESERSDKELFDTNDPTAIAYGDVGDSGSSFLAARTDHKHEMVAAPDAQIQPDWNQTDTGALDYINNKPTIPDVNVTFGVTVDGGGSVLTTGSKAFVSVPYTITVTDWYLAADAAGDIEFDVLVGGTSIIGTGAPILAAAQSGNAAVTGWTAITAGDIVEFVITGTPATITWVNLVIKGA